MDVKYVGDDIHFVVMDEEVMSDDHVGECTVKLTSFIGAHDSKTADMDDWWEIFYDGKSAGHIHMKAIWTPTGETLKELPPAHEIAAQAPPPLVMSTG